MSKTITAFALMAALGLSACANGSSAGPAPEPEPVEIVEEPVTQKY